MRKVLFALVFVVSFLVSSVEASTIAIWQNGDWDYSPWTPDEDYYGYDTLHDVTPDTSAFLKSDYATWWTPGIPISADWTHYPPDQDPQVSFILWYLEPALDLDGTQWLTLVGPVPLFTIEGTPWLEYTPEEYSAVIPEPSTGILTIGLLAGISLLRVRVRRARVA